MARSSRVPAPANPADKTRDHRAQRPANTLSGCVTDTDMSSGTLGLQNLRSRGELDVDEKLAVAGWAEEG